MRRTESVKKGKQFQYHLHCKKNKTCWNCEVQAALEKWVPACPVHPAALRWLNGVGKIDEGDSSIQIKKIK
jgi:hypothetical protein